MRPVVFEMEGDLPGSPERVWELITAWERQSEWMLEMSDVVVTSPQREGLGVTAEATVSIAGISTRDRIRVDAWNPPHHLGIVHEGWVGGRGDLRIRANSDSTTRLNWREELQPPWGIIGAIGLRLIRPFITRTFRRDLGALRGLILSL